MISRYVETALRRAKYAQLDEGGYCATVRGLAGVVAVGTSLESCRDQLAEVVEEWVLVRISRGLRVPSLGGVSVEVKKAS